MDLNSLSRKDLQALAKEHGLKANQSSNILISLLLPLVNVVKNNEEDIIPMEVSQSTTLVRSTSSSTSEDNNNNNNNNNNNQESVQISSVNVNDYKVSSKVQVFYSNEWINATILRINKKSIRVITFDDNEVTVKFDEIRSYDVTIENDIEMKQDSNDNNDMSSNNDKTELKSLADIDESCPISHEKLVEALMSEVKYSDIVDDVNEVYEENFDNDNLDEENFDKENNNNQNNYEAETNDNMNQSFTLKQTLKTVEWNSSAKVPLTFDEISNETNFKKRKSFSNTPVTKVAKPAYEVKLTKAQTLRAESNKMKLQAIENKRLEENIAKNPFEYVIRPKVESKPTTAPSTSTSTSLVSTKPLERKPLSSNTSNVQRISMSANQSNKPTGSLSSTFKKGHENIFKKQKSIVDTCKRDDSININMSRAYETASKQGFKAAKPSSTLRMSTLNTHDKENCNVTKRQRSESCLEVTRKLNMIQYR